MCLSECYTFFLPTLDIDERTPVFLISYPEPLRGLR